MPGQNLIGATQLPFIADVTLTKGQAVVLVVGSEDHVALPAGANSALCFGFAMNDAAVGERVAIHISGGVATAKAGASCAIGDWLMINGTSGDLKPVVLGASNQHVVARCLRTAASGDLIPVVPMFSIAQGA
jgi:hypothetical protein